MLVHFYRKFSVFPIFSVFSFFRFFRFFRFVSKQLVSDVSLLYRNRDLRCFDWTKDPPKQFKREFVWVFFRKFWVVSLRFFQNSSVCFGCFDIGSKHRNKPTFFAYGFTKQTRNRSCFGLFRFEPKFIFVCFEDTLVWVIIGLRQNERRERGVPALSSIYHTHTHDTHNTIRIIKNHTAFLMSLKLPPPPSLLQAVHLYLP